MADDLFNTMKAIALAGAAPYIGEERTVRVATNFTADRETNELGESHAAIMAAEAAYDALVAALQKVQRAPSQEADLRATEFLALLRDARKDASWPSLVGDAQEAAETAHVRNIRSV